MQSKATSVADYVAGLPEDRREAIERIRAVIRKKLPKGYEEGMQYGMIGYYVPHKLYPAGYHCDAKQPLPFAAVASQKNYISVYLMAAYADGAVERYIKSAFAESGRKLDMGKCCLRFKKPGDIPLDIIGTAISMVPVREWISIYETNIKR
ncbi:MAG: DUF1801 domain-containing protein [Acidobacteria bacterium]|nr:DUF1801 domain-containing protein [Acidobacteriota bacterium]